MEPALARARREAIDHDDRLVREWRMARLSGLGIHGRMPGWPPTTLTRIGPPR